MRAKSLAGILLFLLISPAAYGWDHGPPLLERNVRESPVCVKALVVRTEVLWERSEFERSKATINIIKSYKGPHKRGGQINFEYWAKVDNAYHVAHELKDAQTIVVFLNHPRKGYSATSPYLLLFAKGQISGYLYYVEEEAGQKKLVDAVFAENPDYAAANLKLTEFESRLRKFEKMRSKS